jgi:G3E family GTPase
MRILIVSGMLGSGKTSVILGMAGMLSNSGLSIAIVENEIGSVGIDGEVLERGGMMVKELRGGCICCSMRTGMIDALRSLEACIGPDMAIIEPTGVADPKHVISAVGGVTGLTVSSIFTIIVVDAERILKVKRMFERPLKNQIGAADLVLVNKIDTVQEDEIKEIEELIRSMQYGGPILRVQADKNANLDKAAEMIL